MATKQKLLLAASLLLALLVRLHLRAETAFYCDVPRSLAAIESGRMVIQFPGYAPYQNLMLALSALTGAPVSVIMSWFALSCGYGAFLYTVYLVYIKAGERACLLASVVMGLSVFPVYFSCVRATYVMDMLAAAGLLAHGSAFLRQQRSRDYHGALGWFCFGCLMRPLSFAFTGLALVYLLFQPFRFKRFFVTGACLLFTGLLFVSISLPYYESCTAFLASADQVSSALESFHLLTFLTNLFRLFIYPAWGLHIYLIATVILCLRNRPSLRQPHLLFLLLLTGPYFLLLARYIPHAGYYALLLPGLVALPWFADIHPERFCKQFAILLLAVVCLTQLYLVRPVPVRGPVSLVANAYIFQYSAAGLRMGMFETLSSLARKTGVMQEQIPTDESPPTNGPACERSHAH